MKEIIAAIFIGIFFSLAIFIHNSETIGKWTENLIQNSLEATLPNKK